LAKYQSLSLYHTIQIQTKSQKRLRIQIVTNKPRVCIKD